MSRSLSPPMAARRGAPRCRCSGRRLAPSTSATSRPSPPARTRWPRHGITCTPPGTTSPLILMSGHSSCSWGCRSPAPPTGARPGSWSTPPGSWCPTPTRLATSTDGGRTWAVRFVTHGSGDEVQPALSAEASGIHLLYYHRNPNNTLDVLAGNSRNGTGFSQKRVTTQSFPGTLTVPQFDPIIASGYMGDYIANVSDGSHQYFAWGDNRDTVTNFLYPNGRAH